MEKKKDWLYIQPNYHLNERDNDILILKVSEKYLPH